MTRQDIKIPMLKDRTPNTHLQKQGDNVWDFLIPSQKEELENIIVDLPKEMETPLVFCSLFVREWLSTFCLLLLNARLGSDLFLAGPVVLVYINIVFRRPLINPFVTLFSCLSAGDWKKANVSGYPHYNAKKTTFKQLAFYCGLLIAAQLTAAGSAAGVRAFNARTFGDEFVKNAAWGPGQLRFKVNTTANHDSCWRLPLNADVVDFPIRNTSLLKDACAQRLAFGWWFMEDLAASLFLVVAYLHIWKWLRWDDTLENNARDDESRYWAKLTFFSLASGGIGLMNTMAFPTANAGWHNSVYAYAYQALRNDLVIASNDRWEPAIRALGGGVGCALAILYEQVLVWIEDEALYKGRFRALYKAAHVVVYGFGQGDHRIKSEK